MRKTLCGQCDEPSRFKMATFYWRWTWPTGDERGYKQWFDASCAVTPYSRIVNWEAETNECNVCGNAATYPDQLTVFVTYYIPGQDRQDGYVTYHPACFEPEEFRYLNNSVRLEPAPPGVRAGGPPHGPKGNPWDSWAQQGIEPAV